jgi:tRNA (uracil-5-)-methyltransferase TRM9
MRSIVKVYDQIAESWYNFRHWTRFPAELEELSRRWRRGRLLNIGCAHGADFLSFRDGFELCGLEPSIEMLKLAPRYARKFDFEANLVQGDACFLPFSDDAFDWALSVATYHHLETEQERKAAFQELRRVLKPDGEALITVWNRYQPRFWFQPKEVQVPWRTKEKTFYRYHYLFSYPELRRKAEEAGLKVVKEFPERSHRFPIKSFSRNICILVKKG